MQNSLERILVGLAQSLSADVLPHVDDPYARSQLSSAAELVLALADRVEWRCSDLHNTITRVHAVLAEATKHSELDSDFEERVAALGSAGEKPWDNSTLVEQRAESLRCLAEVQRLLAADPDGPLSAVRGQVDELVDRLQDGEYALTKKIRMRVARLDSSAESPDRPADQTR
jgi:hypothetical protein